MVVAPPGLAAIEMSAVLAVVRAYAVLRFAAACPHKPKRLWVTYRLFFDIDPQHKGLLRLEKDGETRTAIFGPDTARQMFALNSHNPWRQFRDYLAAGMEHIWTGYDHILFLLSLLLPAVILSDIKRSDTPSQGFRVAFLDVLKIVTVFTVRNS
jgi:HupE / UreJ protein